MDVLDSARKRKSAFAANANGEKASSRVAIPPLSAPYRAATRASGTQPPWRVGVIAESASLDQLVCFIWLYSNGLSSQTRQRAC